MSLHDLFVFWLGGAVVATGWTVHGLSLDARNYSDLPAVQFYAALAVIVAAWWLIVPWYLCTVSLKNEAEGDGPSGSREPRAKSREPSS